MLKDLFNKLKKSTNRNRSEKRMQSLGTRELIMISSVIFGATLAIILIMAIIKGYTNRALGEGGSEAQGISEEMAADGVVQNAADNEDMPKVETATEGMKTESTPDTTVLAKKEGAKKGYLNRCVFLGDSRTVAMVNYGFFNDDAALAQIGISHPSFASNKFINNAGKEYTLKSYLESHQAPVIYILLGVNGITGFSEEKYKSTFVTLIDSVADMAPNSNIVLVAIGPVDDNGIYKASVQNAWIDKYNDFLLETAKEKQIFYLDITEVLKGSDGQVKSEYNGGDGLHYSGKGCEALFNYIVEHPVPGISDEGEYKVKYIKPDPNRIKATMGDESGIDEDKLKDLMDMMMGPGEEQAASEASSQSSNEAASEASSLDEEEAKKKAEEEEKKKAEEEEKKKLEEEERKKKEEEEAKKKAEEEEAKKKAEEERKRQEEEERKKQEAEEEEKKKAEQEEAEAKKKAEEEERKKKEEEEKNNQSPDQSQGDNQNNSGGDSGNNSGDNANNSDGGNENNSEGGTENNSGGTGNNSEVGTGDNSDGGTENNSDGANGNNTKESEA